MNKLITLLLFCVYIFKVSAAISFIEKGQRPEIFELTDNQIAVFKVKLPDDEFALLKKNANLQGLTIPAMNLTLQLEIMKLIYTNFIKEALNYNVTDLFPDRDMKKEFPGLFIGQDGYPNIDKIIENLNFDAKNYIDFDFAMGNIDEKIFKGEEYNYLEIFIEFLPLIKPKIESNETKVNSTKILELTEMNMDTKVKTLNSIISNSNLKESILNNENTKQDNGNKVLTDKIEDIDNIINEGEVKEFKTKNGTLTVNIDGKEKSFDKITLSLSGQYSRYLVKPNFNLKIRGKNDLFGRSQFKLRSDLTEPTFLRSKLTSDIHKKLGLTGILANYATLYINDEYMGLFVLTDAYKLKWVEQVYGEKDSISLYKCEGAPLNIDSYNLCSNENDEINDVEKISEEWSSFMNTILNAESAKDIEDIFEVDHFIKEMAIEYLLGAWDHIQLGHNYYLYKQPNGKWIYLTYDHDHTFGINLDRIFLGVFIVDLPERMEKINFDYPNYSFSDWTQKRHLIDILILNDPTRFNQALKEIVNTVFNPATLFPHIDELKDFIRPYAKKDYTPDENGNYPGRINKLGINPYTFEHWEANSEFTSVATLQYNAYGIKYWILAKYRYVCKAYDLKCDPIYITEDYKFSINESIAFKGYDLSSMKDPLQEYQDLFLKNSTLSIVNDEPTSTPSINKPSPIAMILATETEVESVSVLDNEEEIDVGNDANVEPEIDSESENEDDKF